MLVVENSLEYKIPPRASPLSSLERRIGDNETAINLRNTAEGELNLGGSQPLFMHYISPQTVHSPNELPPKE